MMTSILVNWGDSTVQLTWITSKELPKLQLITSVHGFCFFKGKLLLVDLNHRGWDFPGGHREKNEAAIDCFKREAMEEGYVEGLCELLGYIEVNHCYNPFWNESSPYPKIGYQVFYRMEVEHIHSFSGDYESLQRVFIHPYDVKKYYSDWNPVYQEILNLATNNLGR